MENIQHQQDDESNQHLENHNNTIRIPYGWKRKLLSSSRYDKIYYITPSGHVLLSNSDVYGYLADPNTCKCSLNPSLTFDEVFNFDSKIKLNIRIDDYDKTLSPCEQWFQSFNDINEFRSLLLDVNLHLFCQYECDLYEIYKIYQHCNDQSSLTNDDDVDDKSIFNEWYSSFDWSQVMMTKNGWLLTKPLRDSNLKHLAFEMKNSGIITGDGQHWSKNANDEDDDGNDSDRISIPIDIVEASTQISQEIERLELEIIDEDLNYFRDINVGHLPTTNQMSTNVDNHIVKYLNNIIQSAKSFRIVENFHSIIFEYGDPIIKMIIPIAMMNLAMNKSLDWPNITLDWLKENFPLCLITDDNRQNIVGPFDHIDPFTMLNRINDDDDDQSIENNEKSLRNDLQKSESCVDNFDNEICYSLISSTAKPSSSSSITKLSTIDIDSSCSSIPIEVIEDLDDNLGHHGHQSIMLAEHIDSSGLLNSNNNNNDDDDVENEEINFEIRLENLDDNACYQMTMNIPKNLLETDDGDQNEIDWNNDDEQQQQQQQQQTEEIGLDPVDGQVELISNIMIEKNDFHLNEPIPEEEESNQQQEIIFNNPNEQSDENKCNNNNNEEEQINDDDDDDDCLIIKEIIENSIKQSSKVIDELIDDDDDDDYDDYDVESLELIQDANEILKMLPSSSSSSSSSLNEIKSKEKYYQRLQRLKRQLEIQCMPGMSLCSDEKVHLSPPLPPQERIFNIGDLVWGPFGDVRFWPGKLMSSNADDNDDGDKVRY